MPTPPKEHRRGTTYLVTKRTIHRRFLLKPSEVVTHVILYCLGYGLEKYRVDLHAFTFMSNHFHQLLTDLEGDKPDYFKCTNALIARALNARFGTRGAVFDKASPNYLECVTPSDALEKGAYTLANPVAAFLCRSRHEWEGARSTDENLRGKVLRIRRPDFFFSDHMPEYVEIAIEPPPGYDSLEDWADALTAEADAHESEARRVAAENGVRFPSAADRRRLLRFDAPRTPPGTGGDPLIACRDPELRRATVERTKVFREAYRVARAAFLEGDRDVVWPYGTFQMRRTYGCPAQGPPD